MARQPHEVAPHEREVGQERVLVRNPVDMAVLRGDLPGVGGDVGQVRPLQDVVTGEHLGEVREGSVGEGPLTDRVVVLHEREVRHGPRGDRGGELVVVSVSCGQGGGGEGTSESFFQVLPVCVFFARPRRRAPQHLEGSDLITASRSLLDRGEVLLDRRREDHRHPLHLGGDAAIRGRWRDMSGQCELLLLEASRCGSSTGGVAAGGEATDGESGRAEAEDSTAGRAERASRNVGHDALL